MNRRTFLWLAADAVVVLSAPILAATPTGNAPIALHARKFEFTPAEITVRTGQPVTLALSAADFVHGFSMPDFGVRRDLIPGQTIEVSIRPTKAGRYHYLCDNFCGDGHDRMMGILVVIDG